MATGGRPFDHSCRARVTKATGSPSGTTRISLLLVCVQRGQRRSHHLETTIRSEEWVIACRCVEPGHLRDVFAGQALPPQGVRDRGHHLRTLRSQPIASRLVHLPAASVHRLVELDTAFGCHRPSANARSNNDCMEVPHTCLSSWSLPMSTARSSGRITWLGMRNSAANSLASRSGSSTASPLCRTRWPSSWANVSRFRSVGLALLIRSTGWSSTHWVVQACFQPSPHRSLRRLMPSHVHVDYQRSPHDVIAQQESPRDTEFTGKPRDRFIVRHPLIILVPGQGRLRDARSTAELLLREAPGSAKHLQHLADRVHLSCPPSSASPTASDRSICGKVGCMGVYEMTVPASPACSSRSTSSPFDGECGVSAGPTPRTTTDRQNAKPPAPAQFRAIDGMTPSTRVITTPRVMAIVVEIPGTLTVGPSGDGWEKYISTTTRR